MIDELLAKLADECAKPNWDGYNAKAISTKSLVRAKAFLASLPEDIPRPELGCDPDGEVNLDWYNLHTRAMVSVSISPSGKLVYCACTEATDIFGGSHAPGDTASLFSLVREIMEIVPKPVIQTNHYESPEID